jgi:hypothetical protein
MEKILANRVCEHLRTLANDGERSVKQLGLQGIPAFAPTPLDAPDDVVTACASEAEAVRWCLDFAIHHHRMSLRAIAKLCGWGYPSYLSEIASDASGKLMPEKRIRKFTLATGCRLLEQFRDRQQALRRLTGKQTSRDRRRDAVERMLRAAA